MTLLSSTDISTGYRTGDPAVPQNWDVATAHPGEFSCIPLRPQVLTPRPERGHVIGQSQVTGLHLAPREAGTLLFRLSTDLGEPPSRVESSDDIQANQH